MAPVVEVFGYIEDRVRDHRFGSVNTWTNHKLYRSTIDRELNFISTKGERFTVPEGSEMVVYRRPSSIAARTVAVACFHHPDKDTQTVVYASGRVAVRQQSSKSMYDYGAQYRISATLQSPN